MRNRIKSEMKKQGRSIQWLADELCISRSSVYKYYENQSQPSIFRLKRISELIGTTMEELIV